MRERLPLPRRAAQRAPAPGLGAALLLLVLVTAQVGLAQSATGPLPPLAPPAAPLPPTFWEQHGVALLAGGLAVLAVTSVVLWFILQTRPPVVMPPEERARAALTRLRGRPEDGQVLSEISRILRQYLLAVLDLPPQELTTAELAAALAGRGRIGGEQVQTITAFFRECDERKFSPAGATAQLKAADRALALVAELAQQPASAPPKI